MKSHTKVIHDISNITRTWRDISAAASRWSTGLSVGHHTWVKEIEEDKGTVGKMNYNNTGEMTTGITRQRWCIASTMAEMVRMVSLRLKENERSK